MAQRLFAPHRDARCIGRRVKKKLDAILASPTLEALAEQFWRQGRVPGATYRLQVHSQFPFSSVAAIAPYLADLGITDCYTSPILRARPGSMHGYDVCDHQQINPELGGEEEFERLAATLRDRQMGLVLDVVPNHMGVGDLANRWWIDLLENGPASRYARYFDVDWHPPNPSLDSKVLLPILGGFYGSVLERGEIRLAYVQGRFWLHYHDLRLPVAPKSITSVLDICAEELSRHFGEAHEAVQEVRSIVTALRHLSPRVELSPDEMEERYREKESIRRRLERLVHERPECRAALDRSISTINGAVGDARSFERLDALINAQAFRPAFWRVAAEEINYRRFFDINDLAAIRIELPEVFRATHELVLRLINEGKVVGMRIDHPDGLRDPTGYFRELQRACLVGHLRSRLSVPLPQAALQEQFDRLLNEALAREPSNTQWPLYVVVEKILSDEEPLPIDWAVAGTTGYDFLVAVNGLFIDGSQEKEFDRIYREFVGQRIEFHDLVYRTKRRIMKLSMASEINSLAHRLDRITERNRRYRDFTLDTLGQAIQEVIATLPVYRTYITGPNHVPERDRRFVEAAVAEASSLNAGIADEVFQFLRDLLLFRNYHEFAEDDRDAILNWVLRFQQITGSIMAKGVEDTAFYIYNRFVSLNEVGGHPDRFGLTVGEFHKQQEERLRNWPNAMSCTSTHDTKRSEDVRARLNVLSEIPGEWESALKRWRDQNAPHVAKLHRFHAPTANDQYLLYQALLGIWPTEPVEQMEPLRRRLADYAVKAAREAKLRTSWLNPNHDYEEALANFVAGILPDNGNTPFLNDFTSFQQRVAFFGHLNSLSQVTLKMTCPGVPDTYQGCELWDFSLVDPDNRRPVDFDRRVHCLADLRRRIESSDGKLGPFASELLAHWSNGLVKLYVTHRLLTLRRDLRPLFDAGDYQALSVEQFDEESVVAFARALDGSQIIVAAPCRVVRILQGQETLPAGKVWGRGRLRLPEAAARRTFRNLFSGELLKTTSNSPSLALADAFRGFPVCVLVCDEST